MINSAFLLTSLIVVMIPGTGAIYTISTGLFGGWRASVAAAVGCTLGIIPHIAASVLGLSLVLHMSALMFHALKFAGAIYLLYLAWIMWHDRDALTFDTHTAPRHAWRIVAKAIVLNILNPKLTLFFFAFLPLFVTPQTASPIAELCGLSAVFMAISLVVFTIYGALASSIRRYVVHSPRVLVGLRRSCAAVFAVLAVQLAVADQ